MFMWYSFVLQYKADKLVYLWPHLVVLVIQYCKRASVLLGNENGWKSAQENTNWTLTESKSVWHILRYNYFWYYLTCNQFYSVEGDEVFWVGLVIVEDHKHGGLLQVVHQTVEAVGGVWASGRGAFQGRITECVTAGQDTSHVQPLQAGRVCWGKSICWIVCIDCKVNSLSIRSSCDRNTQEKDTT